MRRCAGTHFDPDVVQALVACLEDEAARLHRRLRRAAHGPASARRVSLPERRRRRIAAAAGRAARRQSALGRALDARRGRPAHRRRRDGGLVLDGLGRSLATPAGLPASAGRRGRSVDASFRSRAGTPSSSSTWRWCPAAPTPRGRSWRSAASARRRRRAPRAPTSSGSSGRSTSTSTAASCSPTAASWSTTAAPRRSASWGGRCGPARIPRARGSTPSTPTTATSTAASTRCSWPASPPRCTTACGAPTAPRSGPGSGCGRTATTDGRLIVDGIVADVTERHTMLTELAEASARLASIAEAVDHYFYTAEQVERAAPAAGLPGPRPRA